MIQRVLTYCCFLLFFSLSAQETKYKVLNTSINSEYAELGAHFFNANTVVYASSKKIEEDQAFNKTRRRRQRQLFIALYSGEITENGDLIDRGRFLDKTQQNINLSDFAIAPDGKTIFFTWNNYFPYMVDTIENYWRNTRIMKGKINPQNEIDIANAHPLPFINEKNNYSFPTLSKDGKTLYFSSDLPKGAGGMDLYKVDIIGTDTYSDPENLGNSVNSSQDEIFPFIDASNTLYFSSYGHRSKGGLDIFKSKLVQGTFQSVERLEEPINSKGDDFGFIVNSNTQKGYFASSRKDGNGDADIYAFEPDIPECFQNMLSTFTDIDTNQQLRNIQVTITNAEGDLLNSVFITEFIEAPILVKCETAATITIEKEGYEPLETQINTTQEYDITIPKNFQLKAIPCTQFIAGNILHKLELAPVIDAQVSLYANDVLIEEQSLNELHEFSFKVPCDQSYVMVIRKAGFETLKTPIQTGKKHDDTIAKRVLLTPRLCTQTIAVTLFDIDTNTEVSKFKTKLFSNGRLLDEKNIINGNAFSYEMNCDSHFTIEVVKEGYESMSFELATNSSYDVIHEKELRIQAIECIQFVDIVGINPEINTALQNGEVHIYNGDSKIGIFSDALKRIQVPCNSNLTLAINSPGFETKNINLQTTNELEKVHALRTTLQPVVCEQNFTLSVADALSKGGITTFDVVIISEGKTETKHITKGASADFTVTCGLKYKFKVVKDNYDTHELSLFVSKENNLQLTETVFLSPSVCEQVISGRVIELSTGKPLNNALVVISSGNTFSENLSLDAEGNFKFTADCDKTYILKTDLLNYGHSELKITTSSERNAVINKTIGLHRDLEFTTVAGQRKVNMNNMVFGLNETDVTVQIAIELNKIVALLNKYPEMELLVESHTDSRAPDQLNLNLSEGRAEAIRLYLISQGIDSDRVKAKGYGETQLVNKCSNGVKCSEEEHRKNRRTEFVVTN